MKQSLVTLAFSFASFSLWGCSHLVYQPSAAQYSDPAAAKVSFEEVEFRSQDGTRLTGWFFPAKKNEGQPTLGTVIQFHGNADNMTSHFFSLYWMVEAGYNLFAFDYRGYGRSEGRPHQAGVNLDAVAAIEFVKSRGSTANHKRDIILYGQSLGGAVVARALENLSDKRRISAVIIEGSFYSYKKIAQDILSRSWITYLFQPLAHVLVSDEYSPEDSFGAISPIPLLIIHGERDRMIPAKFGKKIYELAKNPKDFWLIPESAHIDAMFVSDGKNRPRLVDWLNHNRLK